MGMSASSSRPIRMQSVRACRVLLLLLTAPVTDVARGLIYMHDQAMIHGDLKGVWIQTLVATPPSKVLFIKANIDQSGHARLPDFGFLTIVSDFTNPTTSSSSVKGGTTRWMSLELLDPDQFGFKDSRSTKESDCYALGMVILEVLNGQVPFDQETGLLSELCWNFWSGFQEPGSRPPHEWTRMLRWTKMIGISRQ